MKKSEEDAQFIADLLKERPWRRTQREKPSKRSKSPIERKIPSEKVSTPSDATNAPESKTVASEKASEVDTALKAGETDQPSGRYDFDLAEFPLFRFYKNRLSDYDPKQPIVYADTITGRDGKPVSREWRVYPRAGVGGSSTQALLFDLLQLYVEQGCRGSHIQFGTLRALFQRQGNRNPSQRDYNRMRRDIEILRNYDFQCKNAFYDREKRSYVDMNWRLFDNVFYFKEKPDDDQLQLPFGFIEVNRVLRDIARTRGFFALGFTRGFFHVLKPMEQRLALYLSKFFITQSVHWRFVDTIARALPIEASRQDNVRKILKQAAQGLLNSDFPLLASFKLERAADGRWKAYFYRKTSPKQDLPLPREAREELSEGLERLVFRIIEATGNSQDRLWWIQCARHLGDGGVDRALGQLKETCQLNKVKNPSAMLTKIFKDIAQEQGIALKN